VIKSVIFGDQKNTYPDIYIKSHSSLKTKLMRKPIQDTTERAYTHEDLKLISLAFFIIMSIKVENLSLILIVLLNTIVYVELRHIHLSTSDNYPLHVEYRYISPFNEKFRPSPVFYRQSTKLDSYHLHYKRSNLLFLKPKLINLICSEHFPLQYDDDLLVCLDSNVFKRNANEQRSKRVGWTIAVK
ncbi:unnamed protein product, partial [Didymodactylos carnosus]